MSRIPLVARASLFPDRPAVAAGEGRFAYRDLLDLSHRCASGLLAGAKDLEGARVAFLTPPGMAYVATQWGIWRAGGMAVPLCVQHPAPELAHVIDDAQASVLAAHPQFNERLAPLAAERGVRFLSTEGLVQAEPSNLPDVEPDRHALLVYTSGTTNRPKGAVLTHAILAAQMVSLVEAWGWTEDDHILHVLPLHHMHGILNALSCALWSGALCELMPKFDARRVWDRFMAQDGLTLFMAVPTIYSRLVAEWEAAPPEERKRMTASCKRLRLMVSGSAALPVPVLERWREISGHVLLERYGMTEMCMALSNPLHGERKPGYVGTPLPGVEVRILGEDGRPAEDGQPGELQVKGPNVFEGYWRNPEATRAAFTRDGWFRTGDVTVRENGVYRILGRQSVDIIKTGGYKVSALEIEEALRGHPAIDECAVVGIDDPEWGQRVAAAVIPSPGRDLDLESLRAWAKERIAVYKVPSLLLLLDELPRNPMGKVTKPDVVKLFEAQPARDGAP